MKSVRFLHISDCHLESHFSDLPPDKAALRREEQLLTFKNILDKFSDADVVLMAGDLFDGECSEYTVIYLCKLFSEHSESHFFICGGNHDSLKSSCMHLLAKNIPDNVTLFGETMQCVHMDNVCIYGASFVDTHMYSSLLSGFRAENTDNINIMVMHGEIGKSGMYNPITENEISDSGLDYLALGHRHGFSGIQKSGDTHYSYSGITEPTGFDECGECGVVYGTISKRGISAKFYPVSKRKYHKIEIDISDMHTNSEIAAKFNNISDETDLYSVQLYGRRKTGFIPDINLCKSLSSAFWVEFYDTSENEVDITEFTNEKSLRGYSVKILQSMQSQNKFIDDAQYIAVRNILTEMFFGGDTP